MLRADVRETAGVAPDSGFVFDLFRRAVRVGQESVALATAIARGITDENRLANLVFFARHPEMGGRRLRRDERGLVQEWIAIRDRLVRPVGQGMSPQAIAPTRGVALRDRVSTPALGANGTFIAGPTEHKRYRQRGNWQSDNAVDVGVPVGTPVYAVSNGVIGRQFGSLNSQDPRLAGLRLNLTGHRGDRYYYAHLSAFAPGIRPGANVQQGQLLGYSGRANGVAHLHLGASPPLNPMSLVTPVPRR